MATQIQHVHSSEPFRWRVFLMVMLIMAAIAAAAIVLTLMANPTRTGVHEPAPQPISQIALPYQTT